MRKGFLIAIVPGWFSLDGEGVRGERKSKLAQTDKEGEKNAQSNFYVHVSALNVKIIPRDAYVVWV